MILADFSGKEPKVSIVSGKAKTRSRAMETIQADAMRLINVKLLAAVEACEWASVHKLSDQLQELAARGMHRNSIDNTAPALRPASGLPE